MTKGGEMPCWECDPKAFIEEAVREGRRREAIAARANPGGEVGLTECVRLLRKAEALLQDRWAGDFDRLALAEQIRLALRRGKR